MRLCRITTAVLTILLMVFLSLKSPGREPLGTDLVGYWRMEESQWAGNGAKDVIDSSLSNHTAEALHGVQTASNGKLGRAGKFIKGNPYADNEADQKDDYVNIGVINFDYPITYSAWIKLTL
ncbi:MAG: hypothetical protein GY750_18225 [Lentisphaerae bacterium]|nr:hypothetical protein [Lentisphaerota bacterium]MCP4103334.1 hypothetical protein [Lentisphaerota bacterium]